MTFKDQIKKDIENVFFNTDEFAEPHLINGCSVNIVVDNDRLTKIASDESFGVYGGDILYFAKVEDFNKKPIIGDVQEFDGAFYQVINVKEDAGVYEIILRGSEP